MPALLALGPLLAGIGSLAGAGVGIGEAVANRGGGTPTTPTTPAPTPPTPQNLASLAQKIGTADSTTQATTSGAAGDDFRRFIDQLFAGTTGQAGSAGAAGNVVNGQQFQAANSQPTNSVVNGQQPNISDFLSSFTG